MIGGTAACRVVTIRWNSSSKPPLASGYWKLYVDHVLQADEGVDLDFLVGKRGAFVPRDNH